MFAEEEWTEGQIPAEGNLHIGVKSGKLSRKPVSKQCLNRTLQTLGSIPTWDSVGGASEGSDGEIGGAPIQVKKKKKKCKKRKKISEGGAEDQHRDTEAQQTPASKRRKKKKLQETGVNTASEFVQDEQDKDHPDDTEEKKISRKQWKNKMKNKKRCKNKFLQNTAAVLNLNPKKEQSSSKQTTHPTPPEHHTPAPTQKNKSKESNRTKHPKPAALQSVSEQPSTEHQAEPQNQPENQSSRLGKNSHHQIKKLRHLLQNSSTTTNGLQHHNPPEPKPEPADQNQNISEKSPPPMDRSSALRSRMEKRLESARFRYINELLYSSTSGEAKRMFQQDPDAMTVYHRGYTQQVQHWPSNPVDSIIAYIRQRPASLVVVDFGCGDCKIARSVKNTVHCFDLAPVCDLVTACDMANVPLADSSVDIAVFCLSLMGTNLTEFLAEANRVLVDGGVLKIAEVASRFEDIRHFTGALGRLGFKLVSKDTDNTHFYCFEFTKIQDSPSNVKKIQLQLNPCLYKKR
ncbi:uncharacterized protein rrp8 [Astyanax mexicanus]|uniref:Ribosomal RNA-processing protein 8 n=1 Tax=Astyanax mexicanus TaxID=7994 RepID=W5KCI0_ASTMX|nr:uncharacterized protein rrp8 [Astyanax mexicanus]XP_007237769.2 uncharacterized protein rrp8 [Astyanax mexicanus]